MWKPNPKRAISTLAVLCLTPAITVAQSEGEDVQAKIQASIETMITAIEEGNDPMRNRMFFDLRIIGNESVPALIDLMGDERVKVREYAIHTVSYIDDERWIDPVISVLQNDSEPSTRAMACRALARTQDTPVLEEAGRKAIPHLIEALQQDEEVVQMDAAFALGWYGDPGSRSVPRGGGEESVRARQLLRERGPGGHRVRRENAREAELAVFDGL